MEGDLGKALSQGFPRPGAARRPRSCVGPAPLQAGRLGPAGTRPEEGALAGGACQASGWMRRPPWRPCPASGEVRTPPPASPAALPSAAGTRRSRGGEVPRAGARPLAGAGVHVKGGLGRRPEKGEGAAKLKGAARRRRRVAGVRGGGRQGAAGGMLLRTAGCGCPRGART